MNGRWNSHSPAEPMEGGPRLHMHNFFCESHLCRKHPSDSTGLHGVPPREPKSGRANSLGPRASRSMLKDDALTQVLAMAASCDALASSSVGPHSHRPPQTGSEQIRRRRDGRPRPSAFGVSSWSPGSTRRIQHGFAAYAGGTQKLCVL